MQDKLWPTMRQRLVGDSHVIHRHYQVLQMSVGHHDEVQSQQKPSAAAQATSLPPLQFALFGRWGRPGCCAPGTQSSNWNKSGVHSAH
mmetsp:Transcript_41786/g.76931  ORF Transcript_41786/g.76931 Transcript_41786/m.76931 type:complete len:88 (+) Transcript_41786:167-430(+)